MDFFNAGCQELPFNHTVFGLCDDENGKKAYTNVNDPIRWVATVNNDNRRTVIFTAIDKCVIKDNEFLGRGRCDCMLTTEDHLFLIELKNQIPPWQSHAIDQLESTIQFLIETHPDISNYKHKKAFACNKRREKFVVIDNELNCSFFRRYKFRIDIQAEIVII
jgi:hypothetical protein